MTKDVVILIGAPGCGKSTACKNYLLYKPDSVVVSADDYFVNPETGHYTFDRSRLHAAHLTCQNKFAVALENGVEQIIVDNTNIIAKHRQVYIDLAQKHGYTVWIHCIEADAETCFKRNVHGVPLETIERMISMIDTPYGCYKLGDRV